MRTVSDIMTKDVISIPPQMPVVEAVSLLIKRGFNGLPVVDNRGTLVGIVTEYDFVVGGSAIHLPTLLQLLDQFDTYNKDKYLVKDDLKKILSLIVNDVMNKDPLTLNKTEPISKALELFSQHHKVNPIPVVDELHRVVGIVSRSDILKFMGDSELQIKREGNAIVDQSINDFIDNFEKRFTVVSKNRARYWLIISILSTVVGFAIAWFLILRVDF